MLTFHNNAIGIIQNKAIEFERVKIGSHKKLEIRLKINLCFIFTSYCPLQIWALKNCNQDISKLIISSSSQHFFSYDGTGLSGLNQY